MWSAIRAQKRAANNVPIAEAKHVSLTRKRVTSATISSARPASTSTQQNTPSQPQLAQQGASARPPDSV